ncbi:two-component system activity regulator YycH [Filibacter tadaridae]|uniref:Two-component system YycF/YycG regulatory protein YycH n=1 Tax=Filibacter tadaridae TaxID=2483811 RepID=A0A3P5X3A0_9BACL|nr:two-component system activity regulator YycH [Filibacter tadaridae]VDC21684.1 Two-component system YycF/YycG regulatory protein YycH [Filibacter tadaridae]
MGLKYIETVKSVVLVSLVLLSMTLTFFIWTYTPRYKTIEKQTVDISIAEKQEIKSIIKPYKVLFNFGEKMNGTTDSKEIDQVVNAMKNWRISDVELEDNNFNEKKVDQLQRKKNHYTLFFHGQVPLILYDNVLNIDDSTFMGASFDRLIVDWNPASMVMEIHFVNGKDGKRYSANAKVDDYQRFHRSVLTRGHDLGLYVDVNAGGSPFIAVPAKPIEIERDVYYPRDIGADKFRDALFTDPKSVRKSQISLNKEQFQDDHALMNINTVSKELSYVYPVAESPLEAAPSELLKKTIDFVNEHAGWTDQFRYMDMNPQTRSVTFQLFSNGLPVFSDTITSIEQVWGENQVFKYIRPLYTLGSPSSSGTEEAILPSGIEVAEKLRESKETNFSAVREIAPGYFMEHDSQELFFIMEPAWFYLVNNEWKRFSPEGPGGELIGLE